MTSDTTRPLLPALITSAPDAQARSRRTQKGMKEPDFEAWRQSLKGRDVLRANVWEMLDSGARRSGREQAELLMQTLRRFSRDENA